MSKIISRTELGIDEFIKQNKESYNLVIEKYKKNKESFPDLNDEKDTRLVVFKLILKRIEVPLTINNLVKNCFFQTIAEMWEASIVFENNEEKNKFYSDKLSLIGGNNKSSLFINIFLEFEHFIRIIGSAINVQSAPSINRYAKNIINELALENDFENLIDLITYIRNTIHFGGFHTKSDVNVNYKGIDYKFVQGEHIHFFDDFFLHLIIKEVVQLVDVIINNPLISEIAEIPHTYSDLTWEDLEE
jgi:hypothetical protein